jgi:IMP dehydrogenase
VKRSFREKLLRAPIVYTFDAVFIEPGRSQVEPNQVSLETRFSRNIRLHIPIASSPMDTVTGWEMAVSMALLGGIGVIHRNMPIEDQVEAARRVKNYPPVAKLKQFYVRPDEPCERVLDTMRGEGVRQVPVVDGTGRVLGYAHFVSVKDLCRKGSEPISKATAGGPIVGLDRVEEALKLLRKGAIDAVALIDSGGFYAGTLTLKEALEDYEPAVDRDGRLVVAAAVSPYDVERARKLDRYVDALVIDVAHFHNVNAMRAAARLARETSADLVVGNVGSYEAVIEAVQVVERVDGVRAGIGGGSICTTPRVTGAYSPTLWAVASARDALNDLGLDVPVVADGGIREPGDAVKALALGASVVMLGYALAGTDEAEAPLIRVGGREYKPYRGMASRSAMERRFAIDRYARAVKRVEEGVEGLVPYRGPVARVVREWVEAIRAGLGYAGARSVEELWRVAKIIAVVESRRAELKMET